MDVLKFFTVRLCPWDMHLTGRRRRLRHCISKLFFSCSVHDASVLARVLKEGGC